MDRVPELRFPEFSGDWVEKKLKDCISSLNSGVSVNSEDIPVLNNDAFGILKTSCILGGIFFPEQNKKILVDDVNRAKLNPIKDSIIISRMNTPQLVGESGYIDKLYKYLYIPDRLWQTTTYLNINVKWLSYVLITGKTKNNISSTATGTSGSMKNISKPNFLSVPILVHPYKNNKKLHHS